jgi:hypothetical protein
MSKEKQPIELPFKSDAFKEAWGEWLQYRAKEKKEPVGPIAEKRQLKLLAGYDEQTALAIIDKAINAGWTGLWPSKDQQPVQLNRRFVV